MDSTSTILIPAPIVAHLRRGLLSQLGDAASQIETLTLPLGIRLFADREPRRLPRVLEDLDACRALLDEIGWRDTPGRRPTRIDPRPHRRLLTKVLRARLHAQQDLLASRALPLRRRLTARRNARQIHRFLTTSHTTPTISRPAAPRHWMRLPIPAREHHTRPHPDSHTTHHQLYT